MTKRVLVVDDEENIRQMTRLTLEAAGYEVGEAGTGMEAFAILGGDPSWDVILLDQKMPGMVGTEVLKRIKVLAPAARVIMVTAFASIELAVEAMQLGASDFVRKPTTPEIVRNAVAAALMKSQPEVDGQSSPTGPAHIRTITMNGFTILRGSDLLIALPQKPNERCFVVRKPDGREQEVVVEISDQALQAANHAASGTTVEKAFWTIQAERFLGDFIWNDGDVPVGGKLVLKGLDPEVLETLARQKSTSF